MEQLARDLKKLAPEDARGIDDFIAGVRSFQRTDMFGTMAEPMETMPWAPPSCRTCRCVGRSGRRDEIVDPARVLRTAFQVARQLLHVRGKADALHWSFR